MDKRNRKFTVRRLFMADLCHREKMFSCYDFLHYNPAGEGRLAEILLQGQIWGIFCGEEMVSATWVIPADSKFFSSTTAAWQLEDLLEYNPQECMIAGYVRQNDNYMDCSVYRVFSRLWVMQTARLKKSMVVHCSPRHINADMGRLFDSGWQLAGLRGMDKLVPHFIFVKQTDFSDKVTEIPRNVKLCPVSDTKMLSMLCEHGCRGLGLDADNNILFVKGSDCFD